MAGLFLVKLNGILKEIEGASKRDELEMANKRKFNLPDPSKMARGRN
jgi:hypothetical protein